MPADIGENHRASPALQAVHPIALPGIAGQISLAAIPDIEAVNTVKGDGQPDADCFQRQHQRQAAEKFYLPRIGAGPVDGGGIGYQNVLDEKGADRNDPSERVQPPPEKRMSCAGAHGGNTSSMGDGGRGGQAEFSLNDGCRTAKLFIIFFSSAGSQMGMRGIELAPILDIMRDTDSPAADKENSWRPRHWPSPNWLTNARRMDLITRTRNASAPDCRSLST